MRAAPAGRRVPASPRMASDCSSENMVLDDCAEFGTLRGVRAGEMLIAGEHPVGKTMISVQAPRAFAEHGPRSVSEPGKQTKPAPVLMACPLLTPCVASAKVLQPACPLELGDTRRVIRCFVFEICILRHPVMSLPVQHRDQVEQLRVASAVIEPKTMRALSCQRNLPQSRSGRLGSSANW